MLGLRVLTGIFPNGKQRGDRAEREDAEMGQGLKDSVDGLGGKGKKLSKGF